MTTETKIPNGTYYLHPDGSCWIAAIYRDGRHIAGSDQATQSTHDTARDSLADLGPDDSDEEVEGDLALAIIRDVMGENVYPECVTVTRGAAA